MNNNKNQNKQDKVTLVKSDFVPYVHFSSRIEMSSLNSSDSLNSLDNG